MLFDARFFELPERQCAESLSTFDWVGIVDGENLDPIAGKLEMKKLVGEPDCRAKALGNGRRSGSFIMLS